jgi:hypothetical protein
MGQGEYMLCTSQGGACSPLYTASGQTKVERQPATGSAQGSRGPERRPVPAAAASCTDTLAECVDLYRQTSRLCCVEHPCYSFWSNRLALALRRMFELKGTGGTELVRFLKGVRDRTAGAVLGEGAGA